MIDSLLNTAIVVLMVALVIYPSTVAVLRILRERSLHARVRRGRQG